MHFVYIIRSEHQPDRIYKGATQDLTSRLAKHNAGEVAHTKNGRPWEYAFYAAFETKRQAYEFERYLKTASGIAFLRKRLITVNTR